MEIGGFGSKNDVTSSPDKNAAPPIDFGVYTHKPLDWKSAVEKMTAEPQKATSQPDSSSNGDQSVGAKVALEGKLLATIPSTIGAGIAESAKDAWEHAGRSAFEIGSGVALGAAISLLSKNPRPMVAATMTWAGRAFVGIAALDLSSRFAKPMGDLWVNPNHFEADKKQLGNNLGDAVFNYSLAVGGGIVGARIGEKYLATTRVGTFLQGFKETEVSAEQMQKSLGQGKETAVGNISRAFVRENNGHSVADLPFKGPIRMREMPNGTHIGSAKDGSVVVTTADGTSFSFKNERSLFGLKNNLTLSKVIHGAGDETDMLTGIFQPTTGGFTTNGHGHIMGKDPEMYFKANPVKIVTSDLGDVQSVHAGGAHLFTDGGGAWHLSMGKDGGNLQSFIGGAGGPGSFDLESLTDRFRALKKGAEVGLTEGMLERAGDIGSGVFEHEVLVRSAHGARENEAEAGSEAETHEVDMVKPGHKPTDKASGNL